ncbi:MAG: MvaI/BcnI family restriction endonuclease [Candidatus Onthomorpha sp.]|nr:MvaI/BcnI family restriction endonuclease [Bacteroidales bacterium]MCI7407834.1 MvaI/BcnI family restriction endonuclease [Bacteroidales bacterium]MDD7484599.1 MvaI/BcnI family restriction endonuclease [Bacteroidales bacterium]MDY5697917.1 MvaI/BcnI family restriction endonuclease [Candidatus Onthomorpha sp.]
MVKTLQLITKEELVEKFKEIESMGWIQNNRKGNDGGVGNTLEDLLGIPENNLPIPNAAEWELKAQRTNTTSLVTLCHMEPSPKATKLVPSLLLPNYGWLHKQAGDKYPSDEMSFRMTLNSTSYTDRGFKVIVNDKDQKIEIDFDATKCNSRHSEWLSGVEDKVGLGKIPIVPYWGFNDLYTKVGTKLVNCFFVQADVKKEGQVEFYHYNNVLMLKDINKRKFIESIRDGKVYIDFDARTGHNHGTKFRIKYVDIPSLYQSVTKII